MKYFFWPEMITGALMAMAIFFVLDYSPYLVHGNIPIEQKMNELQWRIDELEAEMHER